MLKRMGCRKGEFKFPWGGLTTADEFYHVIGNGEEPFARDGEYVEAIPLPGPEVLAGDIVVMRTKGGYALERMPGACTRTREGRHSLTRSEMGRVVGLVGHVHRDIKAGTVSAESLADRIIKDIRDDAKR